MEVGPSNKGLKVHTSHGRRCQWGRLKGAIVGSRKGWANYRLRLFQTKPAASE